MIHSTPVAIRCWLVILAPTLLLPSLATGSDWPAFKRDARRSAVSEDTLTFPMSVAWHRASKLRPRPAFEDPLKHPTKLDFAQIRDCSEPVLLDFDHAYHPVAADGRVFFGSSADDAVRCVSLEDGKPLWTFVTGGPVRFAPHVVAGRVYVTSDDGFVYCLKSTDGEPVWKFRAAPSDRQLVGNGRMISRWPLRTGALVLDDVVYVTAGMWPSEGVFVFALDAATGGVIWVNDTSGTLNQPTANPGAYAISGVGPTGYLLASDKALVVPTGRSLPAAYSREDGRLLKSTAPSYQNRKGGPTVCIDRFNNVIFGYPRERLTQRDYSLHYAYQLPNLTPYGTIRCDRFVADDKAFVAVNDLLRCYEVKNSRYTKVNVEWQQPCPTRSVRCLSLSANALLVGVDDTVVARDRKTGEQLWERGGLDGYVQSIAIVDERLLVATDTGGIYCFAAGSENVSRSSDPDRRTGTLARPGASPGGTASGRARVPVLRDTRGLALVIGETDTEKASELATTTQLQVVLLLDDDQAVQRARNKLLDLQQPGRGQVSVRTFGDSAELPFADFSFNEVHASGDVAAKAAGELYRVLSPSGGLITIHNASDDQEQQVEATFRKIAAADSAKYELSKDELPRTMPTVTRRDGELVIRRGKLAGALDWDSIAKTDQRLTWPLELLWFGGPGSKRTGGGSRAPIAAGGRNFVVGKNQLIALDAYNGTELWARTLPYLYRNIGRLRNAPGPIQPWLTKSINADDDHVWLNFGHVVYTLDAQTGRQLAVHGELPAAPVVPLKGGGLTIAMDHFQKPDLRGVTSNRTQADAPAGNVHVDVSGKELVVTLELNNAGEIDARTYWELFFDVRPSAKRANLYEPGVFQLLVWPTKNVVQNGVGPVHPGVKVESEQGGQRFTVSMPLAELAKLHGGMIHDFCFAAALNQLAHADQKSMAAGRAYLRWEYHADAFATSFNNGWPRIDVGTDSGVPAADRARSQAGSVRHLSELPALATGTARIGQIGQRAGSMVNIGRERSNPLSQDICDFEFNRGKGCGYLVGAKGLQVLRSGTLAFYDLNDDSGMRYFGGVRPACTISAIPAQGLVFAAEGSSGCSCNYNFKTTLALAPALQRRNEDWAMFSAPLSPGAQLQTGRFNLGAPGDRRDDEQNLWLQYPRAPTYSNRVLPTAYRTIPVPVDLLGDDLKPYRINADRVQISGTDRPWLYSSGYESIEGVRIQLFMSDKEGLVVFPSDGPTLDASLEPDVWERKYSVPAGTGSLMLASHSTDALHVGFEVVPPTDRRGKRQPWTLREGGTLPHAIKFTANEAADDTKVWEENSLEFLVSDVSLKTILHLGIGASGGRYDGVWSSAKKKEDATGSVAWSGAAKVTADKAIAEFSIPWATLKAAGLDTDNLVIRPRTRGALTRQPHISHGFRPVIVKQDNPTTKRFRVTLHFAELWDVRPGQRVFDIELQGNTVLEAFDAALLAGGRHRAVSRSFVVEADRVLDVRFNQHVDVDDTPLPPMLSAIELVLEQ